MFFGIKGIQQFFIIINLPKAGLREKQKPVANQISALKRAKIHVAVLFLQNACEMCQPAGAGDGGSLFAEQTQPMCACARPGLLFSITLAEKKRPLRPFSEEVPQLEVAHRCTTACICKCRSNLSVTYSRICYFPSLLTHILIIF